MKRISAVLSAFPLIVSTCAFAQANGGNGQPANGTHRVQPGSAGQAMGHAADAGSASPSGQSLMQRRENAMSPQGASGSSSSTGRVKQ